MNIESAQQSNVLRPSGRLIRVLVDGCIFSSYPHGGIARLHREVMSRICQANTDIEFHVLCDEFSARYLPAHPRIRPLSFRSSRLRPSRIFKYLDAWRLREFNRAILELAPQVFHSTYYTLPPFVGMKTVASVYDLIDHQFSLMQPNGAGFVERQRGVLKCADRVVSISRSTTELSVKAFNLDPAKIETIGLGVSDAFVPASDDSKRAFRAEFTGGLPYFLFVGATGGYKNLGTLIRGFAQIADQTGHALLLAGHSMGSLDPWLIDLAIENKVEEKIILLHRPTDEVLSNAYSAATAFVFPSLQEGFGIPLLEAMKCECKVIASDIPVFREICADAAMYFDPHSAAELAQCLLDVLTPGNTEQAKAVRQSCLSNFSWDLAAQKVERLYRELAAQSS